MGKQRKETSLDLVIEGLRDRLGLRPITLEEAQAKFDAAEPIALSDEEERAILDFAISGERNRPKETPHERDAWMPDPSVSYVATEMPALHRNQGKEDPQIEELLVARRRALLDDDSDE